MNREFLVAALIVATLVRVRCGQPAPTPTGEPSGATTQPSATPTQVAVEAAPATSEASPTPEATIPTATHEPSATPSAAPTHTPQPSATPSPPPSPTGAHPQGVILPEALYVRAGPGREYPVLRVVTQGQRVGIIGRTESAGWVLILDSGGREGWVGARLVEIESPLDQVPVSDRIIPTPVATATGTPAKP